MSIRNLDTLFRPTRVAVVGAGASPTNLGHMVVRNLLEGNFQGVIYPINPRRESIGGVQTYPSVSATPVPPDLAIVCVPAAGVLDVVRECGELGTKGIIVMAAGFREIGAEGRALEQQVAAEAAKYPGTRILGPNCLGLMVPKLSLNASFASHMPAPGNIAFVSQSGALTAAAMEWAIAKGVGFSGVVSLGNMLDINLADVIEYFEQDEDTHSMVLYAESVTGARQFVSAARAFTRTKPIVVYKAGRFEESAKAAVSHTGAMAGADAVYEAAFRRAGVTRVLRIQDIFSTAELLSADRPVHRPTLAVVTNAGGPGVMSADALIARHGSLASLAPQTIATLNEALPAAWSHGNPVDVLGDAPALRYQIAADTVLGDPGVDAVLVILTPQAMTDIVGTADAIANAYRKTDKPVLAVWMGGGDLNDEAIRRLTAAGIPTYAYPELAVDAFMNLVDFARAKPVPVSTPTAVDAFVPDRERARALIATTSDDGLLSELSAKELFDAYGINVALTKLAPTAAEAVALADSYGYPVVLKIASPDITHKTDVGGVVVGLETAEQVRDAFERIVASAHEKRPDAQIDGVAVQRMIDATGSQELILGARRDATFGAVIMVAAGGIATEVLKDQALELAPVDEDLVRQMLGSLRIWPLLQGYRGGPGADVDSLVEVIVRFSRLVAEHPEVTEIEVNPLLAGERGAIALDARAVVDRALLVEPPDPFSHLAVRPYPEDQVTTTTLSDGLQLTLRPIRGADAAAWRQMVDSASPEILQKRFGTAAVDSVALAPQYCSVDYDREVTVVAQANGADGGPSLAGVARLVHDGEDGRSRFAVFVPEPWQGRGVEAALSDRALALSRESDLVVADA